MSALFYRCGRAVVRFIGWHTLREVVLDAGRTDRASGFILACTHISHLEPMLVSGKVNRHIRWMARVEFYRRRWMSAALKLGGAIPVNRQGCSLRAVRTAVRLAKAGECIGIFPEGGVAQGPQSILRGAPFKHGVCTIAIGARVPIVPVVVLGTERLNRVAPWLPFRRGRLWYAFGSDVVPPMGSKSRREARAEMAARLHREFSSVYADLRRRGRVPDDHVP